MKLEMRHIYKSFGAVKAVQDVDLTVEPGQIHGLLGENGAGKTTLMNVLAGTFAPDSGDILIDGNKTLNMTPLKAAELKIRFIHQELNLCNDLKVYQNMFLGQEEKKKSGLVDKETEIAKAQKVLDYMNSGIQATKVVAELDTAQKQLVEIARALLFDSELIIMDEPTTALNNNEIDNLFNIMRQLKSEGVSFIYISHKMPELFSICDKYTVMRDGKFVETGNFSDIDENIATELLIGHAFISANLKEQYNKHESTEVALSVKNLSGNGFKNISFDALNGEVLVITGLQGSGVAELALALFGATDIEGGTITTSNATVTKPTINKMISLGVGMIPRNRKERGILPDLSIRNNSSIVRFTSKHKKLFINNKDEEARFENRRAQMAIKINSSKDCITSLSGGNQQKVIVGRWLELEGKVYLMDNPTQGIDVGAKYEIYKLINELASSGKCIIVFSNEYPEIFQIADKTLVMYKGQIQSIINRSELTESRVMALSTGIKEEK